MSDKEEKWDLEIKPKSGLFEINLRELINYKDLLVLFIKRDIITVYNQTILGPIWFFVQPLVTSLIFIIIFNNLANLKTDPIPAIAFYLCGISIWTYFSDTLLNTSRTFNDNSSIFGKVYFPRLIVPLSKVISGLIKFGIQFSLFIVTFIYYLITESNFYISPYILLFPIVVLLMAALGLGFGLIFSSLTTKYKDLTFLLSFGMQLLMYATPIIYSMDSIINRKWYAKYLWLNPLSSIVELMRYCFFSIGTYSFQYFCYSVLFTLIILFSGILVFNKVEKSFMDTI